MSNIHITEYLNYYLKMAESPKYAVLITGRWGVGKTTFLKKYLQSKYPNQREKPKLHYIYLSLYGLDNTQQINDLIFEAIHPILSNKKIGIAVSAARGYLKNRTDVDLKVDIKDFLDSTTDSFLVFDDLERCNLNMKQVLGYLNTFIEHNGAKVIILADESQLDPQVQNNQDYIKAKEKLIGMTLRLNTQFPEVYSEFATKIQKLSVQKTLQRNYAVIYELFNKLEVYSLRILQQSIWDFERLINKLDKVYSENNIAIDDLLEIFFIFSFWIKKSGVSKNTFSKIGSNIGMYYDSGRDRSEITNIIEKSDLEILEEKIENLHFKDFIFSNNLWKEILFEGYIDEQKINLELSKSNLFSKESSKPSWYKLWHYRDLSESEIIHHFDILEKQFSEHKFIDINEIMHVIGLRLHFTSLGQYPENLEEIIQQCKVYIDHLYATNKLEPFLGSNNSENTYINDTGLSYFNSGKDEFKEIYDYLHKHRDLATKDKLDEYAEEVLQALKTDDKKFFSLICWTNDENENPFQNIPVMTKIAPKEYVSIALSKTDQTYKTAIIMFNERYDSHNIINNLKEEIDWIIAVKDELIKQSKNKTPIFKSIIETLIEVHIDPIINEHDQNKTNKSNLS